MLTRENISEIYRKFSKAPSSIDELNIATLFDETAIYHDILIDPETNTLTIGSIEPQSPFHNLPLDRINTILGFDEWVAIVMSSSIVFLNRTTPRVAIDIKSVEPSIRQKITALFRA